MTSPKTSLGAGARNGASTARRQCKGCHWLKASSVADIPHYRRELHEGLACTIAKDLRLLSGTLLLMACHESRPACELVCIGWLHNQIGVGNNLPLRLAQLRDPRLQRYELAGEQHEAFEDTLPEVPHGRSKR